VIGSLVHNAHLLKSSGGHRVYAVTDSYCDRVTVTTTPVYWMSYNGVHQLDWYTPGGWKYYYLFLSWTCDESAKQGTWMAGDSYNELICHGGHDPLDPVGVYYGHFGGSTSEDVAMLAILSSPP